MSASPREQLMEIPSEFVQTHRLPQLLPFDRQNTHSVVVMDNCAVHHIQENSGHDRASGGNRHLLPPYSPDQNPIEETFSKVKSGLKTMAIIYYSMSSLTNQIAPFEGNNVGYCMLLWQCVMTPDDNFASFECRVCVHTAQYWQWLSSRDRY